MSGRDTFPVSRHRVSMRDCMNYSAWLRRLGVSRDTGWRWERDGKITTFKRYGRKFVAFAEIARFDREGAQQNGGHGFLKAA